MKKTLQDQYLLIKEGKGHKGVFLNEAKRQFPHIVRNAATFEEAVASLQTKNIISENVIGLTAVAGYEPRKKETYETAFEAFLAEARKKENEDEKVKAEEKKVSKPVEKDLSKINDNTDEKNPDNMIFGQIMMGYYAEMKDPKNSEKTMEELKDMVFKNLAKDPIYYTKNAQFGVKDLGYTDEATALGVPKEPKGKYKSSGYGDLKEAFMGAHGYNPHQSSPLDIEDYLEQIEGMSKSEAIEYLGRQGLSSSQALKVISQLNTDVRDMFDQDPDVRVYNADDLYEDLDKFKSDVKDAFTKKPSKKSPPEEIKAKLKQKREEELDRRKKAGEPLEEIALRRAIREMIDAELEEAYQMPSISTANISGAEGGKRFIPTKFPMSDVIKKRFGAHMVFNPINGTFYISDILYNNLVKGYANQPAIKKLIMDIPPMIKQILNKPENYGPTTELPKEFKVYHPLNSEVEKAKEDKFNKARTKQYWSAGDFLFPNLNVMREEMAESLMESIEKDLADINKEAEHEVLQSKLDKIDALIDGKKSKLSKLDEDEDMKALTDKKKVKELEKDIKKLEQARGKVEKMISKFKGKKSTSKEVIDEMEDEPSEEYLKYKEDAEDRYEAGQSIDSIISDYSNISLDMKNMLRNDLEAKFEGTDNE